MLQGFLSIGLVLLGLPYGIWMKEYTADDSASFTAGNTMCRNAGQCGCHNGTTYSWCYIDYNGAWDYCCTTPCDYGDRTYLWCSSGSQQEYLCGDGGKMDIHGRKCLPSHPCGLHHEKDSLLTATFWCYVDINHHWGRCCNPNDNCSNKGHGYNSCYTGVMPNDSFANCTSGK